MLTFFKVTWADPEQPERNRESDVVIDDDYTKFEDIRKIIAIKNTSGDINRVQVFTLNMTGVQA